MTEQETLRARLEASENLKASLIGAGLASVKERAWWMYLGMHPEREKWQLGLKFFLVTEGQTSNSMPLYRIVQTLFFVDRNTSVSRVQQMKTKGQLQLRLIARGTCSKTGGKANDLEISWRVHVLTETYRPLLARYREEFEAQHV